MRCLLATQNKYGNVHLMSKSRERDCSVLTLLTTKTQDLIKILGHNYTYFKIKKEQSIHKNKNKKGNCRYRTSLDVVTT